MPPFYFILLAGAGITYFLTQSSAGEPLNRCLSRIDVIDRMLACSYCTGFWVGLFTCIPYGVHHLIHSDCLYLPTEAPTVVLTWLAFGFSTGIVSMLIDRLLQLGEASMELVARTPVLDTNEERLDRLRLLKAYQEHLELNGVEVPEAVIAAFIETHLPPHTSSMPQGPQHAE